VDGVSARTIRRLVAVCFLLGGLAVMHVLPGMGACPQAMPGVAGMGGTGPSVMEPALAGTSMTPAATHQAPTGPLAARAAKPSAVGNAGPVWSGVMAMPEPLCVATPPSAGLIGLLTLLAVGFVALLAGAGPTAGTQDVRWPRRRGPPRSGALLLCDLCVSRT